MDNNVNSYFAMRTVYGNQFGQTNVENTIPDPVEQAQLEATDVVAPKAVANKAGMLTWLGVLVLFVVLFSYAGLGGGGK